MKCVNAEWQDSYGHYREANYTQIKHQWWWKANRILDQLQATQNHNGTHQIYNFDKSPTY